jgi:ligand-binding SRPBCC domain-containing protein
MIHQLNRQQILPASVEEVWTFFSNPNNLNYITPPDLKFEIFFGGNEKMYQGQLMAYKIQLFPLIKTRWLTEITQVNEPCYFADQQHLGPYAFWLHEHFFSSQPEGVEMRDRVTYQLPFGPIGNLVHRLWVGPRLQRIFDYRAEKVKGIFVSGNKIKSGG